MVPVEKIRGPRILPALLIFRRGENLERVVAGIVDVVTP
jgi:hypothetical protein